MIESVMGRFRGEPDYRFKIVVIGASGSGKTSMIDRLISGEFSSEARITVGVDYKPYRVDVKENVCQLEIWDTAGQEKYRSVAKSYFRNAVGCVLVFDITSRSSFEDLQFWLNEFRLMADSNALVILVGNKADLENERQIPIEAAEEYARDHMIDYLETSAVTDQNVKEAFHRMGRKVFDLVQSGTLDVPRSSEVSKRKKTTTSDQQIVMSDEMAKHGLGCC
jgi:small GTP-binding protein